MWISPSDMVNCITQASGDGPDPVTRLTSLPLQQDTAVAGRSLYGHMLMTPCVVCHLKSSFLAPRP